MPLSRIPPSLPPRPSGAGPDARSPEEAARQFESVLVRQFVEVMTKDLFRGGGEGMMTGQADLQRDTLTDTLADHLVESGTFGIADLLMRQWAQQGRVPAEAAPPATLRPPGMQRSSETHPLSERPSLRSAGAQTVPLVQGGQLSELGAERPAGKRGVRSGGAAPTTAPPDPAGRGGGGAAPPAARALTMDDALRLYPPAQARPLSIDTDHSPSPDATP